MKNSIHIFRFFVGWSLALFFSIQTLVAFDPFSKIVIESQKATVYKDPKNRHLWMLHYDDNVHVSFADGSTITSNHLEIACNIEKEAQAKTKPQPTSPIPIKPSTGLNNIKHIIFRENVTIESNQRHARANKAILHLEQKVCDLEGNVSIWQDKKEPKDIPFSIKSEAAQFDLTKDAISFTGAPVTSCFDLTSVMPKKKKKVKPHVTEN